ncbi:MAG: GumC family protein [Nitrospinota bacterium]
MNETSKVIAAQEPRYRPNSLYEQLERYIVILSRRKWCLILPLIVCGVISGFVAKFMQPYYSSSTLILVEPQQVPDSYVKATDSTPIEARLNTLQQQIMSRTKLEQVIKEFDPYRAKRPEEYNSWDRFVIRSKTVYHEILKKIGKKDLIREKKKPRMESLVARMRKDISVKVVGGGRRGGAAFSINYTGIHPYTTMQITNAVASLYIEENLRIREQYAEGTADFLDSELEKTKKLLEEKELAVQEFKSKFMGSLPEQLDTNLRTLDRLQLELQTGGGALQGAEANLLRVKESLQRAIEEAKRGVDEPVAEPDKLEEERRRLTVRLSQLRGVYKESYPDVVFVRSRLQEVEAQLLKKREEGKKAKQELKEDEAKSEDPENAAIFELKGRIRSEKARIRELRKRERKIKEQIREFEKRVEETSANEQWLVEIMRDYEISRKNYESILEKKLSARLAESMEKRQKGERFRVVDPANLPESPIRPNKMKVVFIGVVFGGFLGAFVIYLLDFLNPGFRRPEDLAQVLKEPILAAVPKFSKATVKKIKTRSGRPQKMLSLYEPMVVEQYYILFTRLEQISQKEGFKVFSFSSSLKGEGKSTTAVNLAYVTSQEFHKRVAIVDCDFKKPVLTSFFPELAGRRGILSVLNREVEIHEALTPIKGTTIFALPVEKQVKNSVSLLGSDLFQGIFYFLKEEFDYVIVDAPPVMSLADMNMISKKVDSTIMVINAGKTPKDIVEKSVGSLDGAISGLVMTGVDVMLRKDYYNYY